MSVYIVGFLMSTLLFASSKKVVKKERWIVNLIALLIPCIIAGVRADSIGTDVQTYLVPMTNAAISANGFKDYLDSSWYLIWRYVYVSDYEIGFCTLVYIVAKMFKNIYAVQFAIQAFTAIPVCMALSELTVKLNGKEKRDWPMWLGMMTYYLMLFNTSLNLMRQAIGMAFILLAYTYLLNEKMRKCVIATVVGVLFHTSAVLGVAIFWAYKFVHDDSPKKVIFGGRKITFYKNTTILIIVGTILVIGVNSALNFLSSLGLGKYLNYISGQIHFMPNQVIVRLPIFIIMIYAWKKMEKRNNMPFLFSMLCFDLLCSQFTSVNSFGGRIALYFSQFQMITFPTIYVETKKNKAILFLLIAYMLFYWWYYFAYMKTNGTVPYLFGI